jgi:flagellar protein FlaG
MDTALSTMPSVSPPEQARADGSSRASDRTDGETRVKEESHLAPPSRVEVKEAADRLNQALDSINRDLAISVHEDSGKLIVEVTDPGTGEVVRQIPAEQVLEVEESIDKIVGLFVNDIA